METSFTELRTKDVVNLCGGTKMGKILDVIFDTNGKNVLGLVVPGERKLFRQNEDIFVPWKNITKIGDDVILINLPLSKAPCVTKAKCNSEGDVGSLCDEDVL